MGIREALEAPRPRQGARPVVEMHLAKMDAKLRKAAEALLASEHSDEFVADAFTDDGFPLAAGAVGTYRRRHKLQRHAKG